MAEYDLTQKLIPHLDRHLAIPLLNHLSDVAIYPAEQLAKAQYDLVKGTNMVDYVESLHEQAGAGESRDFAKLREEATARYQELQEKAQPVMKVIEDPDAVAKLRSGVDKDKNLDLLKSEYNINIDQINALYHFGQYQYTLGAYAPAANFLYHFLIFSPSLDLNISAHWGKLSSNILSGEWDAALTEIKDLRDAIDNPHGTSMAKPLAQLQARTWLLHWSLFVFFNLGEGQGCQGLLEMFLSPAYLNTIQTSCPHLLRYLVAAAVISRRAPKPAGTRGNRDHVKELTKIVQMEEYQYSDPITGFLKDLFADFDLNQAQQRLTVAENVVRSDFFLSGFADEFVENARWLISELYCRIHRRIDIGQLSKTLNLSNEEGEKWIVNLIRDSRMGVEAKIDLKENMLHITRPHATPTATLIETTRGLAFRSQAIQFAMQSSGGGERPERGERGERGGRGGRGGRPRGGAPAREEVAA
ncbi:eukaryotic translation initiation factor 3 subunit E [Kwoniella dejecticola CBS 10117]|uniref:Eukaryotic translation initiation factor 3 subunit E n=1 Tax=Kwoniella dejecticola CBS 10117 TaxID=1296121 RepID=A0A1A5ZW26_9TREE|nr:eukaryotic translation initiation factor 3 subunit E [Kwoniella dejecticola CBS 10117]OBR81999.1 eukaryotic translation initiation factor 3 subunit E [Kwoniella dejecticola CBS 10117]